MPAFPEHSLQLWPVVWHLVMATTCAITALLAREMWQKRAEGRFHTTMAAIGIAAIVQFVLAILGLWPLVPVPITRTLDTACAMLVGWGLVAPFLPPIIERIWIIVALVADLALGIFSYSAWAGSWQESPWTLMAWGFLVAVGVGAGAIALLVQKERQPFVIGTLGVLSVSALLWTFAESAGYALWLAAFTTLPVGMMRQTLQDLESAEQELQSFSQHALRQTQQMLTLVRSSTTLVANTSVSTVLNSIVENIALGTGADLALIALIGDDPDKTLGIMAIHPPRAGSDAISFPLNSHVIVSQAVYSNQQMVIEPGLGLIRHPLYQVLGGKHAGPAIVQPMTAQERTIGIIIVGNTRDNRPLQEGIDRLMEALGAQIAAAVENIRMYHRLNGQARELARLLNEREEESRQRAAILESIADGVVVTDKDDKIIMANAAASNILGIPRSNLLNLSSESIFESVIPIPFSVFRLSDDAAAVDTIRTNFQVNDRSVQSSLAPVRTPASELLGVVAVLRDITRERQAEIAKTEFIETISHELRTPLTAIKGYADLMKTGATGPLTEIQQQFVGTVCRQTDHLIRLINAVIQYSELERGTTQAPIEAFDMHEFAAGIVQSLRNRIEETGVTVSMSVAPGTPNVRANPDRTQQIVDQLLDNALRYTPAPGHITITIKPVYQDPDPNKPSHVSVAVSDTGVGVRPDELERIFERFYRAESVIKIPAGGLGLGLTVARALAVAQGGQLGCQSPAIEGPQDKLTADRPGATFTLLLPAAV